MRHAIELCDVRWKAGRSFEVRDLSMHVPQGSIYGFLGPNGSGKTTTIRMIMGMLRPDAGEIQVLGQRVPKDMPSILAKVGYVPERPHVYQSLTVGEVLRFHASFFPLWDAAFEDAFGVGAGAWMQRWARGYLQVERASLRAGVTNWTATLLALIASLLVVIRSADRRRIG